MEIGPDPDGAGALKRMATRYTYDADGQVTKVERGRTTTATGSDFVALQTAVDTTYDAAGEKVKDVTPAGVVQYSYDGVGRLICTAIRMNPTVYASLPVDACALGTQGVDGADRITRTTYDLAGQQTAITRALGTADEYVYASYTYTPNGQPATVRDGRGNPSAMEYDGFDRLAKLRFPPPAPIAAPDASATDFETYSYDLGGNRISVTRRDGQVIDSCFDALNREYRRYMRDAASCTEAGQAADVFTAYDLRNLALSTRFQSTIGSGVIAEYDKAGRMTSETSFGRAVSFLYDAASNRTRVTYPTGTNFFVVYVYDAAGRVTSLRENNVGTGQQLLATFVYNDLGQRTSLTRGNGTATTYSYDSASRLSGLVHNPTTATWDQTYGFTFNPAGQLKSRTDTNALYRWTPPTAGQATAYDGLNRDAAIAAAPGGYDARGNLTDDGPRTFIYDVENRLTSVTGGGPGLTLAYDPLGRLKSTTSAGVSTDYLYEGSRLIAEYNGATVLRRYVHGPGVDEPLVWLEGSGTTDRRWLYQDRQGSVVAVANGSGNVTQLYKYGPWGEPEAGNFLGSRFRYTGQIVLPEAGLYHYKARVYDPIAGRFMQTDPIGYEDDINLYAYVGGDPVNRSDPTGEDAWVITSQIAGNFVHSFVVVADCLGCPIQARFSYGPHNGFWGGLGFGDAKLVSRTGDGGIVDATDLSSWDLIGSNPEEAARRGTFAREIDAPDQDVITAGRGLDGLVGTAGRPRATPYTLLPNNFDADSVNSNSAAAAIVAMAENANRRGQPKRPMPPLGGVIPPGWWQYRRMVYGFPTRQYSDDEESGADDEQENY